MHANRFATPCLILLCLAGCTSSQPTEAEARSAMTRRMEASTVAEIRVDEIHALELSDCENADGGGVNCQVAMDVTFHYDGERERSKDSQRMRFVREGGQWLATPAAKP